MATSFSERVAIIVVSHNSNGVLQQCLNSIRKFEGDSPLLIIVDSGSDNTDHLKKIAEQKNVVVDLQGNIGFSQANNRGVELCPNTIEYILFLNPDTLFHSPILGRCVDFCNENPEAGCLSAKLLGYDFQFGKPTNLIDSTGIFRKWYGRWYDRGQGQKDTGQYAEEEDILAACGAFMFCRRTSLEDVSLRGHVIFSPDFFLYKEDIELCMRIRNHKWRIVYLPDIAVYHGRGWAAQRKKMSYHLREMSALNELLLYKKHPSVYIVWALMKYLLVKGLRL